MFLEHAQSTPAPGPLHWRVPLSGMLFTRGLYDSPALELCSRNIPLTRLPDLRDVTHPCSDLLPALFPPVVLWSSSRLDISPIYLVKRLLSSPGRASKRQMFICIIIPLCPGCPAPVKCLSDASVCLSPHPREKQKSYPDLGAAIPLPLHKPTHP